MDKIGIKTRLGMFAVHAWTDDPGKKIPISWDNPDH